VASFTADEYSVYAAVFTKIRSKIMADFQLSALWFTAPTFM
jgi:hypothetical protein